MSKKKINNEKIVKSVNKNIRSSTRKLNPILRGIVGKKVDVAIRDLTFSDKRNATEHISWDLPENEHAFEQKFGMKIKTIK